MSLKYTIYFHLACVIKGCAVETTPKLDATAGTAEAEAVGWVTPDGINWYCPTHKDQVEDPFKELR